VATLLAAQQVSGTPDFEIESRHAEAASEIAEFLDGGETFPRNRRQ
jgi:hypothetical protein